jgi:hypothetical protein
MAAGGEEGSEGRIVAGPRRREHRMPTLSQKTQKDGPPAKVNSGFGL